MGNTGDELRILGYPQSVCQNMRTNISDTEIADLQYI